MSSRLPPQRSTKPVSQKPESGQQGPRRDRRDSVPGGFQRLLSGERHSFEHNLDAKGRRMLALDVSGALSSTSYSASDL